jgi:hypothetical protein
MASQGQMPARRAEASLKGPGRGPGGLLTALGRQGFCPAHGCGARIDFSRLMCRDHWRLVPWELRGRVWATWRSGEGTSSPEHQAAVRAAITACRAVRSAA